MENVRLRLLVVCAFVVLLSTWSIATAGTMTIIPSDDSYVHSGQPDSNYGLLWDLYVGDENRNDPAICCRSYLKFSLSAIPPGQVITSARLWLFYATLGGSTRIDVSAHCAYSDAWAESTITWNNAPGFDATATDIKTVGANRWTSWNVTADAQNAYLGDGVLSEVMRDAGEYTQGRWVEFDSKDILTLDSRPYLEVEYQPGPQAVGLPKPLIKHSKWSQPPIEINPAWRTAIYCGWDEPSYAHEEPPLQICSPMVADDFRCLGRMPVTSIHWWGSHVGWDGPEPPQTAVDNWSISFHTNIPAGVDTDYSQPGAVLLHMRIPANRVKIENVGMDEFPEQPSDTCFQYTVHLEPEEYFWQGDFVDQTVDNVFWIGIQARYSRGPGVPYPWGWKTRPQSWMDAAVKKKRVSFPGTCIWTPIEDSAVCELERYDVAFELDTDPNYIKWEQHFTGIRDWAHYEDEPSIAEEIAGREIDFEFLVADDWPCTERQPVTAAVWWGSYIGYTYQACECQQFARPARPDYFLLSIWSDVRPTVDVPYSHPGEKVWEYKAYDYDEVLVGYDKHPETTHPLREPVFRYSVWLPFENWFGQKEEKAIYWFSVVAVYERPIADIQYPWGWTNHKCTAWEPDVPPELAHWKLDETSGLIAHDSSGNANHGTLVGGPTWQPGKICGGALEFGNSIDYVDCGNSTIFDLTNQITVAAWIKVNAFDIQWQSIITKGDTAWRLQRHSATNTVKFNVGSSSHSVVGTISVNDNQWHHVVGVYDGTTAYLYIDGVLDSSNVTPGTIATNSQPVYLGGNSEKPAMGYRSWHGLIDDVRIYGQALSASDVQALAEMGMNDTAVAGMLSRPDNWMWKPLQDQTERSEDMSFILFTEPGCYPSSYPTYADWLALGKPNCWCGIYGNPQWPYQCDGDADNVHSGVPFRYRVYMGDLSLLMLNWKKKAGNVSLDPCADFDHDDSGMPFMYRVYMSDLAILVTNWKKTSTTLPGTCP